MEPLGGSAEVKLLRDGDEVLHQPQVQAFDRRNLPIGGHLVLDFARPAAQTGVPTDQRSDACRPRT